MKITGLREIDAITDVICDVCGCSTRMAAGSYQYGTLQAHWGFENGHDGQRFEVHLSSRTVTTIEGLHFQVYLLRPTWMVGVCFF